MFESKVVRDFVQKSIEVDAFSPWVLVEPHSQGRRKEVRDNSKGSGSKIEMMGSRFVALDDTESESIPVIQGRLAKNQLEQFMEATSLTLFVGEKFGMRAKDIGAKVSMGKGKGKKGKRIWCWEWAKNGSINFKKFK